jgi:predicted metalloprotease with PDZ domain
VRRYSRSDVVSALRAVAPLDWETFLTDRVDRINARAPLAGIERGGWKLVYDDAPNEFLSAREKVDGADNLSLSLGLWVKPDGAVSDVVHGSPVFAAAGVESFSFAKRALAGAPGLLIPGNAPFTKWGQEPSGNTA